MYDEDYVYNEELGFRVHKKVLEFSRWVHAKNIKDSKKREYCFSLSTKADYIYRIKKRIRCVNKVYIEHSLEQLGLIDIRISSKLFGLFSIGNIRPSKNLISKVQDYVDAIKPIHLIMVVKGI